MFSSFGQTTSTLRTYFDDADYDISQEDYSSALLKLLKIYRVDSTNANVNYEIGICYLNSVFEKNKATSHFEKAIKNLTQNYEVGSYDEKRAPYDAFSYLGDAYALQYDIKKAIDSYKKYGIYISPKEKKLIEKNDRKILSCDYANILTHNPVKFEKQLLTTVNTPASDYFPVLNKDQSQIYFTSEQLTGKPMDEKRIYKSLMADGKWQTSINFTDKISSAGNLSVVFLSQDGKILILTDDDESGKSLYESLYENRKWSAPRKMSKKINCGSSQPDACLSTDGKTIYFSSNRKDSYGGFDIYKSQKKAGEWGDATNLGSVINTPYDDICPRILDDNKTLFFSSKGHTSIGGYDIFYSKLNDQKNWGEAINMGFPLNTSEDEDYYWPIGNGFSGYMSLNSEFGFGEKEIYFVKITPPEKELTIENITNIKIPKDTASNKSLNNNDNTTQNSNNDSISKNVADKNISALNNPGDTTSDMTILIKVTKNPLESAYLKDIDGIRAYKGKDDFIRYYYGKYKNYDDASMDFDKILKLGFYSAQLKNLKEDTLYFYASLNFNFGNDSSDIVPDYQVNENVSENVTNTETQVINQTEIKQISQNTNDPKKEQKKEKLEEEKLLKKTSEKKAEEKQKQETKIVESNTNVEHQAQLLNDITERLINATNDIWIIQIATLPKEGYINAFKNISYTTEHDCKDGKYRYSTGVYENIDDARKYLDKIKSKGYADAYIVNFNKIKTKLYTDDISKHIRTYNLNNQLEQAKTEETKLYSIQIGSSIKPIEPDYFKGITDLKEKQTKNGFYKYFYGKLSGYKAAKAELEKARNLGYNDAFITAYTDGNTPSGTTVETKEKEYGTIGTVEKNETNANSEQFTIQVASAKKQSNMKYFKGLEVSEIKGKNNFFIYIYGNFSSIAEARVGLKKVRNAGFKDAYINKLSKYE